MIDYKSRFSIFNIDSDKLQQYADIIETAASECRVKLSPKHVDYVYYESHHILPQCLFPEESANKDNLILLTGVEHFRVHILLAEMFCNESKLQFAAWRMATDGRGRNITEQEYEYAKRLAAIATSHMNTGRKFTPEHIAKIVKARCGYNHSEQTRYKISKANTGKKLTLDHRYKLSQSKKGKPGHFGMKSIVTHSHNEC